MRILLVLSGITGLIFAFWLFQSIRLHRSKPSDVAWRGIIKHASNTPFSEPAFQIYQLWLKLLGFFFILAWVTIATWSWKTDNSFFIVIFPLLLYYFFARYFFWEKADLTD